MSVWEGALFRVSPSIKCGEISADNTDAVSRRPTDQSFAESLNSGKRNVPTIQKRLIGYKQTRKNAQNVNLQ